MQNEILWLRDMQYDRTNQQATLHFMWQGREYPISAHLQYILVDNEQVRFIHSDEFWAFINNFNNIANTEKLGHIYGVIFGIANGTIAPAFPIQIW